MNPKKLTIRITVRIMDPTRMQRGPGIQEPCSSLCQHLLPPWKEALNPARSSPGLESNPGSSPGSARTSAQLPPGVTSLGFCPRSCIRCRYRSPSPETPEPRAQVGRGSQEMLPPSLPLRPPWYGRPRRELGTAFPVWVRGPF